MKSLRFLDRRVGFSVGALGMLFGMVAPAVVPAFASADQVTSRSIQMSSSIAGATASYQITFTPVSTEPDVVLWFCGDSPIIGATCAAPSGMNLSSATVTGPGGTPTEAIVTAGSYAGAGANYIVFNGSSLTAGDSYTFTIGNVTNPDGTDLTASHGTFYGRIETFHTDATAEVAGGDAAHGGDIDGSVITSIVDQGGVAMALSSEIGVSAAVRESMTFCVFGDPTNYGGTTAAPDPGCADTTAGVNAHTADTDISATAVPASIVLGQDQGDGTKALETGHLSTGEDWAQLSTNAASGAVVYLQNNNSCGGLSDDNGSTCHISPANGKVDDGGGSAGDFVAGIPAFGVKLGSEAAASGASDPTGTLDPNAAYDQYNMMVAGSSSSDANSTGGLTENVGSTYGGYLFGSGKAPVSDQNIPLTFAASISNGTPAGLYKATLNLIAVGTF